MRTPIKHPDTATVLLNLRAPRRLVHRADAAARDIGCSRSLLMRAALAGVLDAWEASGHKARSPEAAIAALLGAPVIGHAEAATR